MWRNDRKVSGISKQPLIVFMWMHITPALCLPLMILHACAQCFFLSTFLDSNVRNHDITCIKLSWWTPFFLSTWTALLVSITDHKPYEDEEQKQTDEIPRGTTFIPLRVTRVNAGFLSYFKARIKKIMQKDEEVGKVAQATPIVICICFKLFFLFVLVLTFCLFTTAKALELFLGLIIEQSSKVTMERGSKKVEAYHLCALV